MFGFVHSIPLLSIPNNLFFGIHPQLPGVMPIGLSCLFRLCFHRIFTRFSYLKLIIQFIIMKMELAVMRQDWNAFPSSILGWLLH